LELVEVVEVCPVVLLAAEKVVGAIMKLVQV